MSLKSIRDRYGVPATLGARISFDHGNGVISYGKIKSSLGNRIRVKFEGEKDTRILHPVWNVKYIDEVSE